MDRIEINYHYSDENGEEKYVSVNKRTESLHDYEVCELFVDFMNSVGFSEENVRKYFQY